MKNKKAFLSIFLILIFLFTACAKPSDVRSTDSKNEVENTDKDEDGGLVNKTVERKIGVPYEVGVTPDD